MEKRSAIHNQQENHSLKEDSDKKVVKNIVIRKEYARKKVKETENHTTMFICAGKLKKTMDLSVIKREVTPTAKEENELKTHIQAVLKKIKVTHTIPMLGGSGAKQTWLKNTHDIDIYVKFSYQKYKDRSEELSDILHDELKRTFTNIIRLHGSRDYFQIKKDGYTFEIVPILNIKHAHEARNITDVSHLHVDYVKKSIKKKKSLSTEIRLAKQFAKGNHVYGAESFIKGFSGYVLELLTIHYGSFMNLVQAASKWKGSTRIGGKSEIKKLNPSKLSCLVVIDPVQPGRNAAAAMSEEKYYDFIMACRAFLKHQSLSFFKEKPFDISGLHRIGKVIELHIIPLSGKRDIVGAKLL